MILVQRLDNPVSVQLTLATPLGFNQAHHVPLHLSLIGSPVLKYPMNIRKVMMTSKSSVCSMIGMKHDHTAMNNKINRIQRASHMDNENERYQLMYDACACKDNI